MLRKSILNQGKHCRVFFVWENEVCMNCMSHLPDFFFSSFGANHLTRLLRPFRNSFSRLQCDRLWWKFTSNWGLVTQKNSLKENLASKLYILKRCISLLLMIWERESHSWPIGQDPSLLIHRWCKSCWEFRLVWMRCLTFMVTSCRK